LSFALIFCAAAAAPQNAPAAKKYNGYRISVLSMERMEKWSAGGKIFEPREQSQEFVVIRISVKPLEKQKDFTLSREMAAVRDADGKNYAMPLNKYGVPLTEEGAIIEVPFAVPDGTKLSTLQIGDAKFGLAAVRDTTPKPGA
jgi:hypothetical protein